LTVYHFKSTEDIQNNVPVVMKGIQKISGYGRQWNVYRVRRRVLWRWPHQIMISDKVTVFTPLVSFIWQQSYITGLW